MAVALALAVGALGADEGGVCADLQGEREWGEGAGAGAEQWGESGWVMGPAAATGIGKPAPPPSASLFSARMGEGYARTCREGGWDRAADRDHGRARFSCITKSGGGTCRRRYMYMAHIKDGKGGGAARVANFS